MTKIENEDQYVWAERRVEELLPLVNDSTPTDDPNYIELVLLSNLVADYSEEHYALGESSPVDVMETKKELIDFDAILDEKYGKKGTASREKFEKEAEAYCLKKKIGSKTRKKNKDS